MELISVIIPCYNQGHYLDQAIESAFAQTYPRVEIVVVDDGSADNTSEVVTRYAGVRSIRQCNQGLSAARNAGLGASHGEYIVFLDADDRLLSEALQAGADCLDSHPESAFVSGHHRLIDGNGNLLKQPPQKRIEHDHYLALLEANYIEMHATVMYRRNVLESVGGFDTSLPACEDYEMYLRIARRFPIYCHGRIVAEYRRYGMNMSCDSALMLKTIVRVLGSQWRHAKTDSRRKAAYARGMLFFQRYYGEELVCEITSECRPDHLPGVLKAAATLARYAPRYLAGQLCSVVREFGGRAFRAVIPSFIRRLLASIRSLSYDPPVGFVRFGDLRRVVPLSYQFGFDRGTPIDRYYIENVLSRHANDIQGRVLEVGDDAYTNRFGGDRVTLSDVLHIEADNPRATIVADLADGRQIPSDTFDCFICTQTLHLIYDVRAALQTIHRMLKPGGVVLATFPGISQISQDKWSERWYWSFTSLSARRLFEEVFPAVTVQVEAFGNVLSSIAFLQGVASEELRREELDFRDARYETLITVRAVKS